MRVQLLSHRPVPAGPTAQSTAHVSPVYVGRILVN